MKALILNSGKGSRMGELTVDSPKCLTKISATETILSRQLRQLAAVDIDEVVITLGFMGPMIEKYCVELDLPLKYKFVYNEKFESTNYIFSIYCARKYLHDDILLMHGDLVVENEILDQILASENSCVAVSSTLCLPEKDFKAVIQDGTIEKIGVEFFQNALTAQPLYRIKKADWEKWLSKIEEYCEAGITKVYAEKAFNEVSGEIHLKPLDIRDLLCNEIDDQNDLAVVRDKLQKIESRIVYMCFSTDIIHSGHIAIIKKAQRLGRLMIGVLSDEAVGTYKRLPIVPCSERKAMFQNIAGVYKVVDQNDLSYLENLKKYKPDIVVHGDDWASGFQKAIRDEVTDYLATYGGRIVEFPYARGEVYHELESRQRRELAMPDLRRGALRKMLDAKGFVTAMEAHDGLTGLVVENTRIYEHGGAHQFDAMWISSLCDSTAKGKPDIELVDMTSRFRTIEDICEVTSKPIIFDGDTGGITEHFVYTVRTLERLGVSMVIIEDKTGLKKNSLFGTEVKQTQDSIENFSEKIRAGKKAQRTSDFMICARIESLILEKGMEDALQRAFAFSRAGADAIMIHSRKKEPDEILEFLKRFRAKNTDIPIVLVPTSFDSVKEESWKAYGANIIIYANQLMRAAVPAIQKTAVSILTNHRAQESSELLMPFSQIIRLIPEEV